MSVSQLLLLCCLSLVACTGAQVPPVADTVTIADTPGASYSAEMEGTVYRLSLADKLSSYRCLWCRACPSCDPAPQHQGPDYVQIELRSDQNRTGPALELPIDRDLGARERWLRLTYLTSYNVSEPGDMELRLVTGRGDTLRHAFPNFGANRIGYTEVDLTGVDRIASLLIQEVDPFDAPSSSHQLFRIYGLELAEVSVPKPPPTEDATAWLANLIQRAPAGSVVDLRGDTFLLAGMVEIARDSVTVLGGTFYSVVPRFANQHGRADYFVLRNAKRVTIDGAEIYGRHHGDKHSRVTLTPALQTDNGKYTYPHYLSRSLYVAEGRGLSHRVDIWGRGRGTLEIYQEGDPQPLYDKELQLSEGDTVAVYFQLRDSLRRVQFRSTFSTLELDVYNRTRHVYAHEFSAGVWVSARRSPADVSNLILRNVHIESVLGDGWQFDKSLDCTIEGTYTLGASRQGGSVSGGAGLTIRNSGSHNTGRAALDLEPYTRRDTVRGLTIENWYGGNCEFTTLIANNWAQITDLTVDGLTESGTTNGCWLGGGVGAKLKHLTCRQAFNFSGAYSLIDSSLFQDQVILHSGTVYDKDPQAVTGYNVLQNSVIERSSSDHTSILRSGDAATNIIRHVAIDTTADYALDLPGPKTTAYHRGNGQLIDVRVQDFERYFPGMLQHATQATTRVKSGGPLRSTPKIDVSRSPTRLEIQSGYDYRADSSFLTPGVTYYYRLGAVPLGSEEVVWLDDTGKHNTIDGGHNALRIPIKSLADVANGQIYRHLILQRATAPGAWETQYELKPTEDYSGLNNNIQFRDYGTYGHWQGGAVANSRFFGYAIDRSNRVVTEAKRLR